jgi:hypothetical protein
MNKAIIFYVGFLAVVLFIACPGIFAQGQYKPGDRVECDSTQMGLYDKGTVVPFRENDLDKTGRVYPVKLDKDTIPGLTRDCMATHMRPLAEEEPKTDGAFAGKATKYKPGDRVECDKSQIGHWEKGTVVHFLQNDMDKESGRYYRVRLDSFKAGGLYSAGHQCMTNFIRPLAEPAVKPSGRFKVGDTVEAKPWTEGWLPAKVIGVEGAFYKVRFDGRDSSHDEFVADERIRRVGAQTASATHNTAAETPRTLTPKMAGALPSLRGTAWKIDYGKGLTGNVFLFCKSGRWEIVPQRAGLIGAVGRSYTVSGSTLTTVNADDGKVEKWKMSWKGGVLEIFDGKVTLRLHYNGETTC